MKVDVLGMTLEEGIEILRDNGYKMIKIKETYGLNNSFRKDLKEPRIIKIIINNDEANLVIGYF